jgi:hypothetical protein
MAELVIGDDGVVRCDGRVAQETDVSRRTDLPMDHPLHGSRAMRCVPSGMSDCKIGPGGRLVSMTATPVEIGEVERKVGG